jgi:hypothetical protein
MTNHVHLLIPDWGVQSRGRGCGVASRKETEKSSNVKLSIFVCAEQVSFKNLIRLFIKD